MNKLENWNVWRENIAQHCHGRWESVITAICSDLRIDALLNGNNVTCPECDKKEKLYIRDDNTLSAHCCSATCNAHYFDGIHLAAVLNDESQTDTLKRLESHLGLNTQKVTPPKPNNVVKINAEVKSTPKPKKTQVKERGFLEKTIQPAGDSILSYLSGRGIDISRLSQAELSRIYYHPKLRYFKQLLDDNDTIVETEEGEFEAMVCKVYNARFDVVGYHKTYLEDGKKASVSAAKQLTKAEFKGQYSELGGFIPFSHVTNGHYGIAEGVETSLALICMGRPCWSVINANGIKTFQIPHDCTTLDIYGDLDRSGTGQRVMIDKFYELKKSHPHVKVNLYLPSIDLWDETKNPKGIDFLDVFEINPNVFGKGETKHVNG